MVKQKLQAPRGYGEVRGGGMSHLNSHQPFQRSVSLRQRGSADLEEYTIGGMDNRRVNPRGV